MATPVLINVIMTYHAGQKNNDDSLIFCGTGSKNNYIAGFVFN